LHGLAAHAFAVRPRHQGARKAGRLTICWLSGLPSAFERAGESWSEIRVTAAAPSLALEVVQDVNTPPEILASGARETIADLNPQFRALSMGEVETIEVAAPAGRRCARG
jgi:hypothetical protein